MGSFWTHWSLNGKPTTLHIAVLNIIMSQGPFITDRECIYWHQERGCQQVRSRQGDLSRLPCNHNITLAVFRMEAAVPQNCPTSANRDNSAHLTPPPPPFVVVTKNYIATWLKKNINSFLRVNTILWSWTTILAKNTSFLVANIFSLSYCMYACMHCL